MSERPACPPENAWICPYLTIQDPEKALLFYEKHFGFKVIQVVREKFHDRIMYARIEYKGLYIAMGPDVAFSGRTGAASPARSGSVSPIFLYVYVDDVDALYQHCQDNDIEIIEPIEDKFWGDRMFKCRDIEGYIWDFATHRADADISKSSSQIEYTDQL